MDKWIGVENHYFLMRKKAIINFAFCGKNNN